MKKEIIVAEGGIKFLIKNWVWLKKKKNKKDNNFSNKHSLNSKSKK